MKELSRGVIGFSKGKVLLIQNWRGTDIGFPKGRREGAESSLETARRELFEETNMKISAVLLEEPVVNKYQYQTKKKGLVDKTV
jgi:8-oxo-dGTP pyrophosphatase MutT (NUDIX family)